MPQELLDRIVEKYSSCLTYQDSGLIEGKLQAGDWAQDAGGLEFSSVFIRPTIFRFDYIPTKEIEGWQPFSLVSDGDSFRRIDYSGKDIQYVEVIPNMESSVVDYNGRTFGHLLVIAQLLMPPLRSIGRKSILDLTDLELSDVVDELSNDYVSLVGRLGVFEYKFKVNAAEAEVVEFETKMTTDAETQAMAAKSIEYAKEAKYLDFDKFQMPEDLITSTAKVVFSKRVFDDSLTIDSVVEV